MLKAINQLKYASSFFLFSGLTFSMLMLTFVGCDKFLKEYNDLLFDSARA
jgi:hypothetical protein